MADSERDWADDVAAAFARAESEIGDADLHGTTGSWDDVQAALAELRTFVDGYHARATAELTAEVERLNDVIAGMCVDHVAELFDAEKALTAERDALRAVVEALPRCSEVGCLSRAMWDHDDRGQYDHGGGPRPMCDEHAEKASQYDVEPLTCAPALRAYERIKP